MIQCSDESLYCFINSGIEIPFSNHDRDGVWISDLYKLRFLRFYFSVFSLVSVSIEKIHQTLETVFHRLSKHLEFSQKYSAARLPLPDFSRRIEGTSARRVEADELNERIEGEASAARRVLTTISRTTHLVSPPSYSSNSNTSLMHRNGDNLERIRIPTFSGNKN